MIGLVFAALASEAVISPDELARHASGDDCWIAIEGGVYDVTRFVVGHPGGAALVDACGADGTERFLERPESRGPHSAEARALLSTFRIGDLDGEAESAEIATWRIFDPMRARAGVVAPSGVLIGHNQLYFGFAHHFHFPDSPERNVRVELGWGIANVADVVVAHSTWSGEGGLQARVAFFQQGGRRRIGTLDRGRSWPLTLGAQASGGMRTNEDIADEERVVGTAQLIAERTFGPASLSIAPGVRIAGELAPYTTLLLDLAPHHTGGMFGELVVSRLGQRLQARFSAGLRIYTRAHAFTFWGGNSPSLAPGEAASPVGGAGFGFSLERRFAFPGG